MEERRVGWMDDRMDGWRNGKKRTRGVDAGVDVVDGGMVEGSVDGWMRGSSEATFGWR